MVFSIEICGTYLVGGLEHEFYVPQQIGMMIQSD